MLEAIAFARDGPISVTTAAHSTAGDLILGAVDRRAATWIRGADERWVLAPQRGATVGSRTNAAAGNAQAIIVSALSESAFASELWRYSANRWQRVVVGAAFPPRWTVRAITWTGDRFVAVGFVGGREPLDMARATPAIWSSPDGETWRREDLPPAPSDGGWLTSVSSGPGGVIAGGAALLNGQIDGLLVRSDVNGWSMVSAEGLSGEEDEQTSAVSATDTGWLVTGRVSPPECKETGCITRHPRLWTSPDGVDWTVVDVEGELPAPFGADGSQFFGTRDLKTISSSEDGRAWADLTEPLVVPDQFLIQGMSLSQNGFLAAGATGNGKGPIGVWEWR